MILPFESCDLTILWTYLPPVLTATLCGMMVGFERQVRGRGAGLKTNVMICVGSTLFTTTAYFIAQKFPASDPTRILSYIISGIGFLGTGVIFKEHDRVKGLTTASLIWVLSAIGIIVGSGALLTGFIITLGLVIATLSLTQFEKWFFPREK